MNSKLLEQIIRHVFSNLLIIKSDFIDPNLSKSLKSKDFLLKEKLDFDIDGDTLSNNIWGCNISSADQEIKLLLGDCSQSDISEYCLIVHLKDNPIYGVYFIDGNLKDSVFLAFSLNEKDWLQCNTYLQATFLLGMEHMKELGLSWNKCSNYKSTIDIMKSFIKYHDMCCEIQ